MTIDGGTLVVSVVPNTAGFNTKLTALMNSVGTKLSKLGPEAAVGAAFAVAGAAAIKSAADFEAAFTRIDAISNASAANIAQWKGQVLQLAGETAQSPQELADALYFLASAGLETSQVMDVLEQSAKSSAVGLGTTTDIAKISAQALNAYAESGLTATEVTDTLTAAVREGTAEPEEFAVALGRVLPIASRAGVGFDEVTASLASLSNIGLNVNEGTTALRGLLQALVAPSGQAAQALAEAGISAEQMRKTISEGGLLTALQLLEESTGGNIDQLRKIIPNIRALTGELGLTGENAQKVQQVFDDVLNSQGAAAQAFATTAEGPMFKFNQVLAEAQVLMIQFGEVLLPIAQSIAGVLAPALGAVAGFLGDNADLVRNLIIAYLGFRAVTFVPLLLTAISTALEGMAAAGLAKIATGLIGISEGLAAVGATQAASGLAGFAATLPALAAGVVPVVAGVAALGAAAVLTKQYIDGLDDSSSRLSTQFGISEALSAKIVDQASGLGARDLLSEIADPNIFGGDKERQDEFAKVSAEFIAQGEKMGLTYEEVDRILQKHVTIFNKNRDSQLEFSSAVSESLNEQVRADAEKSLKGILDYGKGITRVGLAGKYTTSIYDQFGTTLLDNQRLTLSQKASIAGQIDSIYELGGGLNYARVQWLQQNEAAGNFKVISEGLNEDIAKLTDGLDKGASAGAKSFASLLADGDQFATAIGTDFESIRQAATEAFTKDHGEFGDNWSSMIDELKAKTAELAAGFSESIGGFLGDTLAGFADQTSFSVQGVIGSFNKAKIAARDFGQDLITISKTGGEVGRNLAQSLAAAGPAQAAFANFIASAGPKTREAMVKAFGSASDVATNFGTKLANVISGPLHNMVILLKALVQGKHEIPLSLNDHGALGQIHDIASGLNGLDHNIVINIQLNREGWPGRVETGGFFPGAARGGFVDTPQLINVAERHRAEMILPLTNTQGEQALAKAMGNAARRMDGGMVRGGDGGTSRLVLDGPVVLSVDGKQMKAHIRGIAREEDDGQARYNNRISRMTRKD